MTLRPKLILSFLLVSLVSLAAVGSVAWWLTRYDLQRVARELAFGAFRQDVANYLRQYGSWAEGSRRQSLQEYLRVLREPHRPPAGPSGPPPWPGPDRDFGGPLGPRPGFAFDPGAEGGPRPGFGGRPNGGEAAPPREAPDAPFRFVLVDSQARVLLGGGRYEEGERVPAETFKQAVPIEVDGRVEVLALPPQEQSGREVDLSPKDRAYLDIMRRALLIGMGIALACAALLGMLFGNRIAARLQELARALRELRMGEAQAPIPIRSHDEFGQLATAFNAMSAELHQAHNELQQTNQTIREQAAQLKELSVRDPLTQLYNRRHFDEQAATLYQLSLRNGRPLCVMLADLDHFKSINDTYSHSVGDEVLRRAAAILMDSVRRSDVVARYGGEEFVGIFPECDLANAAQRCESLRQAIEAHPWHQVAPGLRVTMSIGLCDASALGSVEKMLSRADACLYEAKRTGRNRVMPAVQLPQPLQLPGGQSADHASVKAT